MLLQIAQKAKESHENWKMEPMST